MAALLWHDAGWAAFRLGDSATARDYWDRGLRLARSSGSREAESPLLNSVAVGYATIGDLEHGIEIWSECIELRQQLGDSLGQARAWGNLANAYSILGRFPEARYVTAVEGELNAALGNVRGMAASLHRQAGMLMSLGQLDEALVLADSAVSVTRAHDLDPMLADLLPRRAAIRFDLGDEAGALRDMDEALESARRNNNLRSAVVCEANLAVLKSQTGNPGEALQIFDSIFARSEVLADEIFVLQCGVPRARALMALDRVDEARTILEGTIARYEDLREEADDPFSKAGLLVRAGAIYSTLAECLHQDGRDAEAWAIVERGSSAVFRTSSGPTHREPITLTELQDRLQAARAALLQFPEPWGGDLSVYLVTGTSVQTIPLPQTRGLVRDARTAVRLMSGGDALDLCQPVLDRISGALLGPIVANLPQGVDRLYVVVSADLAGFPLECLTLPAAEGSDARAPVTLGDRWPISYLPGATALRIIEDRPLAVSARNRERNREVGANGPPSAVSTALPQNPPMLALADPIVVPADEALVPNPLRAASAVPLPFARQEIERIAPRGAEIYLGAQAGRNELVSGIGRDPSVVHIATHGVIDAANPARSALLLAGSPPLVSAADIESLQVRAELVTLSGCRTLGGYSVLGEGVFGLARSFLLSGARSVVSSVWDVEDEASARFMERFYAGLREGLPRDESLRAARRALAADGYSYRDWAGFVLTGLGHEPVTALAGTSLAADSSINRWMLVLVLTLILVFAAWRTRGKRPGGPSRMRTILAGWGLLGALLVGSFVSGCAKDREEPVPPYIVDGSPFGLRDLDLRDVIDGQLAPSLVPSLNDPATVSAEDATYLDDGDRVVGVVINGEARAYPLAILWYHYAINDVVGGVPIIVTHVMHSGSSVVFEGRFEGERRFFQTTGFFYASNILFRDATITEKPHRLIPQMYGVIVEGPSRGTLWPQVPCVEMRWAEWKALYPETRVLSRDTGYVRNYGVYPLGTSYQEEDNWIMFPLPDFPGADAPWKDWVFGVGWGHYFKVFLLESIVGDVDETTDVMRLLEDFVGGEPIAIVVRAVGVDLPTAWALRRTVSGRTVDLELVSSDGERELRDPGTGARWSASGQLRASGTLTNASDLEWVPNAYPGFWFAWSLFHLGVDVRATAESRVSPILGPMRNLGAR